MAYDVAGCVGYARRGQLRPWIRGKVAAIRDVRRVLVKRRNVQRSAVADPEALWAMMEADWVGVKRREKRFDFGP